MTHTATATQPTKPTKTATHSVIDSAQSPQPLIEYGIAVKDFGKVVGSRVTKRTPMPPRRAQVATNTLSKRQGHLLEATRKTSNPTLGPLSNKDPEVARPGYNPTSARSLLEQEASCNQSAHDMTDLGRTPRNFANPAEWANLFLPRLCPSCSIDNVRGFYVHELMMTYDFRDQIHEYMRQRAPPGSRFRIILPAEKKYIETYGCTPDTRKSIISPSCNYL